MFSLFSLFSLSLLLLLLFAAAGNSRMVSSMLVGALMFDGSGRL